MQNFKTKSFAKLAAGGWRLAAWHLRFLTPAGEEVGVAVLQLSLYPPPLPQQKR